MTDHSSHAAAIFNKLANHYQNRFMDVSAYAHGLNQLLQQLPPQGTLLEIACGPGNITRYLLNQKPGLQILGTDLAPDMVALAKANCPEASFEVMDCRQLQQLQTIYQAVVIGFCLPYLNHAEATQLLQDAANLLTPGGCLYLSTIAGAYDASRYRTGSTGDVIYMHYYSMGQLQNMVQQAALNIIYIEELRVSNHPDADTDLIVVALKKQV
jgi:2-polyprenyl-3-methyl-5-hydroxy-6-metoxy-1,4-benzoquinol methylase